MPAGTSPVAPAVRVDADEHRRRRRPCRRPTTASASVAADAAARSPVSDAVVGMYGRVVEADQRRWRAAASEVELGAEGVDQAVRGSAAAPSPSTTRRRRPGRRSSGCRTGRAAGRRGACRSWRSGRRPRAAASSAAWSGTAQRSRRSAGAVVDERHRDPVADVRATGTGSAGGRRGTASGSHRPVGCRRPRARWRPGTAPRRPRSASSAARTTRRR